MGFHVIDINNNKNFFGFQSRGEHKMAANVFGAKQFKPVAPDKGSFPLDHEGSSRRRSHPFAFAST